MKVMKVVNIKYQDGQYQYDKDGTPIAEWNEKACDWVVLSEYEDYYIHYDSDEDGITELPRACKHSELPDDLENTPDFRLEIWYIEHKGDKTEYDVRYWGYLDYSAEEAKENLVGMYRKMLHDFYSVTFKLYMNDELIYEGQ